MPISLIISTHALYGIIPSVVGRSPVHMEDATKMGFPRARWLGILSLSLAAVVFLVYRRQQHLSIEPRQVTLPADGAEHSALRIGFPGFLRGRWDGDVVGENLNAPNLRLLESRRGILEGVLLAPVNPGRSVPVVGSAMPRTRSPHPAPSPQ